MTTQLKWMIAVCGVSIGVMTASAQAPEPPEVTFHREIRVVPGGPPGPVTVDFIGAEMSFSGKPVKGAPYTADSVTETTQTLSDGNRITRKSTNTVYRDSEGRTRREETMTGVGPWSSAGDQHKTIFIHDPAAGVSYVLNPQTHTAHKLMTGHDRFEMMVPPGSGDRVYAFRNKTVSPEPAGAGTTVEVTVEGTHEARAATATKPDAKTESLGKQMIEGVEAEGTRSTTTIPAGAIGNERPIEAVSERWYSPELQTVVMSKHSDPRFGETVYRLVNIQRGEQPAALFELPSDYAVKDDATAEKIIRRRRVEEAK
jgi:hypothetical protein